jgi:hypothetical protein
MPASRVLTGGFIQAFRPDRLAAPSPITLPFTETWTVANASATLSGDFPWVPVTGGPFGWRVSNGRAELVTTSAIAQAAYLNRDTGTDDVAVMVTYPFWTPGTNTLVVGPMVRMSAGLYTGYCARLLTQGGVTTFELVRFLAGSGTPLGQAIPVTPHAAMTVSVSAVGNRIRARFDGLPLHDLFDGGIPSGHFVGLQGFNNGTGGAGVDDLAATVPVTVNAALLTDLLTLAPMAGVH